MGGKPFFLQKQVAEANLHDLRGQGDNFHKVFAAQLTANGTKNTSTNGLTRGVNYHRSVVIETHISPVFPTDFFPSPHHHSLNNRALLY
jgi:hypothetical protein